MESLEFGFRVTDSIVASFSLNNFSDFISFFLFL